MTLAAMEKRAQKLPRAKRKSIFRILLFSLGVLLLLLGTALSLKSTFLPSEPKAEPKPAPSEAALTIDVPFLSQQPNFPTGCESVSAVMALRYFGINLTPEDFVSCYLPLGNAPHFDENGKLVGCDPRKAFPGDPREETGWGCYAPVIAKALREAAPELSVTELSGAPLEDLCETYLKNGIPVLLWVTIDMAPPEEDVSFQIEGTEEAFTWVFPMHCALLTGFDDTSYYFNDPLVGKNTAYSKEAVDLSYKGLGSQAVVVCQKDLPTSPA